VRRRTAGGLGQRPRRALADLVEDRRGDRIRQKTQPMRGTKIEDLVAYSNARTCIATCTTTKNAQRKILNGKLTGRHVGRFDKTAALRFVCFV